LVTSVPDCDTRNEPAETLDARWEVRQHDCLDEKQDISQWHVSITLAAGLIGWPKAMSRQVMPMAG
jgi:hypothetical protein